MSVKKKQTHTHTHTHKTEKENNYNTAGLGSTTTVAAARAAFLAFCAERFALFLANSASLLSCEARCDEDADLGGGYRLWDLFHRRLLTSGTLEKIGTVTSALGDGDALTEKHIASAEVYSDVIAEVLPHFRIAIGSGGVVAFVLEYISKAGVVHILQSTNIANLHDSELRNEVLELGVGRPNDEIGETESLHEKKDITASTTNGLLQYKGGWEPTTHTQVKRLINVHQ